MKRCYCALTARLAWISGIWLPELEQFHVPGLRFLIEATVVTGEFRNVTFVYHGAPVRIVAVSKGFMHTDIDLLKRERPWLDLK